MITHFNRVAQENQDIAEAKRHDDRVSRFVAKPSLDKSPNK